MKKELKIGIFVVAVIVTSFFVLNYLRGEDILNREYKVVSRYDNVEGLVPSAPVFIKGYKAGKVVDVSYDSDKGDFVVICSISNDFVVPSDSKMVIYGVDIMGTKGVKIDLGKSDAAVENGASLVPAYEAGLMDSVAGNIAPLLEKVTQTLDSLSVTVSGVNRLLSESNQASFSRTLVNIEKTMANLRALSSSVNGKSDEITALVDNLYDFSSRLGALTEKVDTAMTGVGELIQTVNESDINGVVTSFKSLLDNINDPDGSIGRLMNNDSVYNSVDSLLNDVNVLVNKIKENPKKYLKISVF
jgi:phospholipid/cholesterol/gamma-HCH transport system substrate-binding protein